VVDDGYWQPAPVDRWWEHLDPAPVVDEWMARQIIAYHNKPHAPCSTCSRGLICERLVAARGLIGEDGAAGTGPQ
jgi:hypothetical protein